MQELKLNLEIDDINLVLEGLGHLPFARVYALVGKIQEQAARQLQGAEAAKPEIAAIAGRTQTAALK
jgi:hypothetical protein